ncbi:MAG: hypothetical protein WC757_01655 [Candidatus Paceibacterota bacterium]|jgi:hypothetical protein
MSEKIQHTASQPDAQKDTPKPEGGVENSTWMTEAAALKTYGLTPDDIRTLSKELKLTVRKTRDKDGAINIKRSILETLSMRKMEKEDSEGTAENHTEAAAKKIAEVAIRDARQAGSAAVEQIERNGGDPTDLENATVAGNKLATGVEKAAQELESAIINSENSTNISGTFIIAEAETTQATAQPVIYSAKPEDLEGLAFYPKTTGGENELVGKDGVDIGEEMEIERPDNRPSTGSGILDMKPEVIDTIDPQNPDEVLPPEGKMAEGGFYVKDKSDQKWDESSENTTRWNNNSTENKTPSEKEVVEMQPDAPKIVSTEKAPAKEKTKAQKPENAENNSAKKFTGTREDALKGSSYNLGKSTEKTPEAPGGLLGWYKRTTFAKNRALGHVTRDMENYVEQLDKEVARHDQIKAEIDSLENKRRANKEAREKIEATVSKEGSIEDEDKENWKDEDKRIEVRLGELYIELDEARIVVETKVMPVRAFEIQRQDLLKDLIGRMEEKITPHQEAFDKLAKEKTEIEKEIKSFQEKISKQKAEIVVMRRDLKETGGLFRFTFKSRINKLEKALANSEYALDMAHKRNMDKVDELVPAREILGNWQVKKRAYERDAKRTPTIEERERVDTREASPAPEIESETESEEVDTGEESTSSNGSQETKTENEDLRKQIKALQDKLQNQAEVSSNTATEEAPETGSTTEQATPEVSSPEDNLEQKGMHWPAKLKTLLDTWKKHIGGNFLDMEFEKKDLEKEYSFDQFAKLIKEENNKKGKRGITFGEKKLTELLDSFSKLGEGEKEKTLNTKKVVEVMPGGKYSTEDLFRVWNEIGGGEKREKSEVEEMLMLQPQFRKFQDKDQLSFPDFQEIMRMYKKSVSGSNGTVGPIFSESDLQKTFTKMQGVLTKK